MKLQVKGTIVSNSEADVYRWYGYEVTAPKDIVLPTTNEPVDIEINSGGGEVFAGAEIYTTLRSYQGPVNISIVGFAASAASVIAMAGDTVKISPMGMMMIHDASDSQGGNAEAHKQAAKVLDGLSGQIAESYAARTGRSTDEFKNLMAKETWFTAKAAVEAGLADEVMFADEESLSAAASIGGQLSPEALAKGRAVMAMDESKTATGDQENTVGNMAVTIDGAEIAQLVAEALQPYQEALDNLKSQEQEPEVKKPTGFLF